MRCRLCSLRHVSSPGEASRGCDCGRSRDFNTMVLAFGGAARWSACGTAFLSLAKALPWSLCGIDSKDLVACTAMSCLLQTSMCSLSRVLRDAGRSRLCSLDLILGGWSQGSILAARFASNLEVLGFGARSVFTLDNRTPPPSLRRIPGETLTAALEQREILEGFRRTVGQQLEFTAPLCPFAMADSDVARQFKSDQELAVRRVLSSRAQQFELAEATHFDVGVEQAWDVATKTLTSIRK
eukprot:TRINITY_DN4182_c0_g1_i1.p2 TRINITY_DN4182_c0_g1~~TRINITY_DN4182_c0_g1_i1.p2  ORF type:complete len:240 (-),score=33.18 TRINITY_DN4182_c0_g1_i1:1237-1956(-)